MHSISEREFEIARIAESKEARAALEMHLEEIIEGVGFRGSQRSGQFLRYIVEQAVAGRFDSLKERAIGIELFGRAPSYDTGEDAIVRVTASDVRKRLLQHYGSCEILPEFRISLPLGSYIPEIVRENHGSVTSPNLKETHHDSAGATVAIAPSRPEAHPQSVEGIAFPVAPPTAAPPATRSRAVPPLQSLLLFVSLVALGLSLSGFLWMRSDRAHTMPAPVLPWSAIFGSSHPTHLITSDPDIYAIQILTHRTISVSDYANHRYLPEDDGALSPEVKSLCTDLLSGDKSSGVDAQIAAKIGGLAKSYSRDVDVQGARGLRFSDLRTDDNFIFLGSPASNPWFSIFEQQLGFRFVPAPVPGGGFIRNLHPAAKEPDSYVPTARGGATGESFALVALVGNPEQSGQVLLLAGLNREGTQAAGNFVSDPERLSAALRDCGIPSAALPRHFEILLRVDTMAGSPSHFGVASCHTLAGPA